MSECSINNSKKVCSVRELPVVQSMQAKFFADLFLYFKNPFVKRVQGESINQISTYILNGMLRRCPTETALQIDKFYTVVRRILNCRFGL